MSNKENHSVFYTYIVDDKGGFIFNGDFVEVMNTGKVIKNMS